MRSRLEELPSDGGAADAKVAVEGNEDILGDVNVLKGTAHALVADGSVGGAAVGRELDAAVAEGVAVGRGAHLLVREGKDTGLATVVVATGAEASGEVGEVAGVRAGVGILASLEAFGGEWDFADTANKVIRV